MGTSTREDEVRVLPNTSSTGRAAHPKPPYYIVFIVGLGI